MLIAQLSDTHIAAEGRLAYRRVDTAAFLARCVEHVRRLVPAPDVVLATGDLVESGQPEEYERLRRLLAPLAMPVYVIPGNHDDRDALRAAFADHSYLPPTGFIQYVIGDYPVRLIALDTLVPGSVGGVLCDERLAWLAARLHEASEAPTVMFMHHPPFETGIEFMDHHGLENSEALADVVRRHTHVEAVLAGHLHRAIHRRWAGTVAMTAPSSAHQIALALGPAAASGFTLEPAAVLLHVWRPGQGLVTHASYIGDYPGPFPFREGGIRIA